MNATGCTIFDTPIGCCGVAWSERGILGVLLPDVSEPATRARLVRRHPRAREMQPGPRVQAAIESIVALLRGEPDDLSTIELDMEGVPEFHRRVYEHARTIAPGRTSTY